MDAWVALAGAFLGASLYGLLWLGIVEARYRGKESLDPDPGPLPGYVFFPGERVDVSLFDPDNLLNVWSVEAMHASARTRLVVTAAQRERDEEDDGASLEEVAWSVQRGTGAQVVVLDITENPHDPTCAGSTMLLVAGDGGGWSGTGHRIRVQWSRNKKRGER